MRKEKFVYNTQTLRYEKVIIPTKTIIFRILGIACTTLVTLGILTSVSRQIFPSEKEKALMQDIKRLNGHIDAFNTDFKTLSTELEYLQRKDAEVHRMIFGVNPIDNNIWNGGIGGHNKYANLDLNKDSRSLMEETLTRVDKLKRKLVIQSKSLDTISNLAGNREEMFISIPSIKPVREDKLARKIYALSGFGRRLHPVHKVWKMHYGIDFTAKQGTPIQSTGQGKVYRVENKRSGYGKNVVIDHGYGFKTLYAHMSRVDVKVGQKVKKGQQIGLVGTTGTSTAPHCHYEVWLNGNKVNPVHYVMDGLTTEEYQELVNAAETPNQAFDYE
ncbi:MAG: M23 family metallopeptidase [Bacteroidetes bacterium]|jgi:biotin carboxyl carrier protein|nr:M23 family metallopeptidase [Bacteroidota bacterium]MDF1867952.1 M23 family metallopeptidase [Saprospiraceae bacterium]